MTCLLPMPLAGVRLGDSASVLRRLGSPRDSTRRQDVDDGGPTSLTTYRYSGLEIDVVRGTIDRIAATVPGGWPRGLAVGSSERELNEFTSKRRLLRTVTADTVAIPICQVDLLRLTLGGRVGERTISRVELEVSRP
jgi:hypothetical protein